MRPSPRKQTVRIPACLAVHRNRQYAQHADQKLRGPGGVYGVVWCVRWMLYRFAWCVVCGHRGSEQRGVWDRHSVLLHGDHVLCWAASRRFDTHQYLVNLNRLALRGIQKSYLVLITKQWPRSYFESVCVCWGGGGGGADKWLKVGGGTGWKYLFPSNSLQFSKSGGLTPPWPPLPQPLLSAGPTKWRDKTKKVSSHLCGKQTTQA